MRIITPGGSLHGEELRPEKSYARRRVTHGEEYTPRGVHIMMRWRLGGRRHPVNLTKMTDETQKDPWRADIVAGSRLDLLTIYG